MKVAVILPAAGLGTRMGKGSAEKTGTSRKQFMLLEGSPILLHTVRKFAASRPRQRDRGGGARRRPGMGRRACWPREFPGEPVRVVEGGNSRQQSVENALRGARPGHRPGGGARRRAAVHRSRDHRQGVRRSGRDRRGHRGRVRRGHGEAGEPRHRPGAHPRHPAAREPGAGADARRCSATICWSAPSRRRATTASSAPTNPAWWSGWTWRCSVVLGSDRNIKITKPGDMDLARLFLARGNRQGSARLSEYRTGLGWDVHRLARRPAADPGRRDHSLRTRPGGPLRRRRARARHHRRHPGRRRAGRYRHALPRFRPALEGLRQPGVSAACRAIWREARGFRIVNVDSTVILERPKLKDYRTAIRERLAATLGLDARPRLGEVQDRRKGGPGGRRPLRRGAGGSDAAAGLREVKAATWLETAADPD